MNAINATVSDNSNDCQVLATCAPTIMVSESLPNAGHSSSRIDVGPLLCHDLNNHYNCCV